MAVPRSAGYEQKRMVTCPLRIPASGGRSGVLGGVRWKPRGGGDDGRRYSGLGLSAYGECNPRPSRDRRADGSVRIQMPCRDRAIRADLVQGRFAVGAEQELTAIRNLLHHLGNPPRLGVRVGTRVSTGMLGVWGFAMLFSTTTRDIVDVAARDMGTGDFPGRFSSLGLRNARTKSASRTPTTPSPRTFETFSPNVISRHRDLDAAVPGPPAAHPDRDQAQLCVGRRLFDGRFRTARCVSAWPRTSKSWVAHCFARPFPMLMITR